VNAAPNRREDRARLNAVVAAISRDDTDTALQALGTLELEAFYRGDPSAGEFAAARDRLAGEDRAGAAAIVQRLLDRDGGGS
jgi:hypothetical protein